MADEYVPVGGWEAAGYSGFSPAPSALSTVNQQQFNTYAPVRQPEPQQLVSPDLSYAQQRGWNPDQTALQSSGPALVGGSWGYDGGRGGLLSDGYQYSGMERSGVPIMREPAPASPYGDLSGSRFQDPTGGASNGSLYPGGDYNDQFNAPYTNPYGDLSGAVASNPYGNLSGVNSDDFRRSAVRGEDGGVSPYGDLSGANFPSPYGDLPSRGATQTSAPADSIYSGGAGLQSAPTTSDSYLFPTQPLQMPTTRDTYGAAPADVAPSSLYDQSYMDASQGSYGSLMGGPDHDSETTYESLNGTPLTPPPSGRDAYLFPTQPLVMPTSRDSAASAGPMPSRQMFAQDVTQQRQPMDPAFGQLNPTFQPMPGTSDTKFVDRAPQMGGFVSYGASEPRFSGFDSDSGQSVFRNEDGSHSFGTQPSGGVDAISRALAGGNIFGNR